VGDSFEVAVDVEATLDEAPGLADLVRAWLIAEGIVDPQPTDDGHFRSKGAGEGRVQLEIGRKVFFPVQGSPGPAACPRCGYPVVLTDVQTGKATIDWQSFSDALTDWHNGGAGEVRCVSCASVVAINDWYWQGDWPVAVGNLGITFWNWSRLDPSFVRQLGERLGHRVVVTRGTR
jgi:hypothetical protein